VRQQQIARAEFERGFLEGALRFDDAVAGPGPPARPPARGAVTRPSRFRP
jgi:hypothetical protein